MEKSSRICDGIISYWRRTTLSQCYVRIRVDPRFIRNQQISIKIHGFISSLWNNSQRCYSVEFYVVFSVFSYCSVCCSYFLHTGCNRRNGPDFGRVFLMLNYTENPQKHLYPKLNGLGDNGQWILKLWQLLHPYWLPKSYWNWQEYVVSVMLIAVRNIRLTCELHKAIKLNYKNTRTRVIVVLRLPSTLRRPRLICYLVTSELP